MTLKGGTSQACAACKYQRRRCISDCPLAPYFPADQPKMFQNAHRLFGVSNILKILKQLDPSQKKVAMKSIIYQANARDKHPVYGCVAEIQNLVFNIQLYEEELQAVHAQLAFYRQQQQHQQQEISSTALSDSVSHIQLGMPPPPAVAAPPPPPQPDNGNGLTLFHQGTPSQQYNAAVNDNALPVQSYPSYSNNSYAAYNNNTTFVDPKENNAVNSLWIQQSYGNSAYNSNTMIMQSQLPSSQAISVPPEVTQDYDEIHPFFDTIDDRQSYIDSKEAYDSSSESSLKDTRHSVEHVAENELKSAAACFTLTSVN
ncbi:LOB domain-containing protein 27-like [Nicotiana tabacum]|uniref:LOB domain-containing protein 27-like n=2 Tax=Nicotiana TaxID=4085 RepID=A0A1S4DDC0_TOBAC|nr:PREDICTED: LOB domain-containing protein 27-like [Nicotiana sylvestris]XP_016511440.1 PREDICTED: LOB domain-containing protein 27-like [Nicotiana tabacum]